MAKLFSDREIRAIAVFLPLAGLLIIALMLVRPAADPEAARRAEAEMEEALPADSVVMSHFDPNTASLDDLRRLGLTKHEAVSLLKYRAAGKVFRIPEDLTLCYGISGSTPGCASAANTPSHPKNTARDAFSPNRSPPGRSASTP